MLPSREVEKLPMPVDLASSKGSGAALRDAGVQCSISEMSER